MADKKRIGIIGAGASGLSLAIILAKHKYDVVVLEQNQQLGGNLQVFSRNKQLYDASVHYLGGLQTGGNLERIFKYLGVYEHLNLIPLEPTGFDVIRFPNNRVYKHATGYENFKRELLKSFPEEEAAIDGIIREIKEYCNYFPLYNLQESSEISYYENPEVLERGAWELMAEYTSNKELIQVIMGSSPLYAGIEGVTPFYVVALILNSYILGSYRLEGGGSQLTKAFVKECSKLGVEILKRKKVTSAKFNEHNEVNALICADGTVYPVDGVISTLHPATTIDIFGEHNFLKAYAHRVKQLPNTVGAFMVHLQLKPESIPFPNCNYYEYFTENRGDLTRTDMSNWPEVLYVVFGSHNAKQSYSSSLSVMAYLDISHFSKWEHTSNSIVNPIDRGADYAKAKDEFQAKVLKRVLERWPELEGAIIDMHASSPLTYRDFLNIPEGSLYGIQKNIQMAHSTVLNSKTRISNVYLSGQNLIFHGILGACIGSLVTSFNFVSKKEILQSI
jgi:phytoene dehydrogenase-like protein